MKRSIKLFATIILALSSFCFAETPIIFCQQETDDCQAKEALQLAKQFSQHFEYSNQYLTLKFGNKKRILHLNQPLTYESEDERSISIDRYLPNLNWLVVREIYDGGESLGYSIIDIQHQLKTTELAASPVISPDNKFFITYGIDLEAGFSLNGIVVYQIGDQGDITEVFRQDDTWGVGSAKWISSTNIELISKDYCDETRADICDKTLQLSLQNNRWQLITP